MSFCYTVITPAAFPSALINQGLWLPPWIELGAMHRFGLGEDGLMDTHLWILHMGMVQHLRAFL